jgi:UDPglucose--hexose-1-phosphate uridylyltransferase
MTARRPAPELFSHPHRRYNPLTDEWLLVSAERTSRPWLGREEAQQIQELPEYDPSCYLCPGNVRANGEHNPDYESTFVFTNDFAALQPDSPPASFEEGLLRAQGERGTCKVICFSPRHDLTLSGMSETQARTVVDLWADQSAALGKQFPWVQVFENRGAAMGASNPHPHGQIWAGDALPREADKEDTAQRRHFEATGRRLLLDYAAQEVGGPRDLGSDDDWLVVVPFWAAWPFETLVIPRRPVSRIPDLDSRQRDSLARRLTSLLRGYDGLFGTPFPYSMGWHQAPFDRQGRPHWQLHAHFYPPLLHATVRKFMVGYELLSEPQRDITAEDAAERLRSAINGSAESPQAAGQASALPGDGLDAGEAAQLE